jgi:hypothetical protein
VVLVILIFLASPFIGIFAGGAAVMAHVWRVFARITGRLTAGLLLALGPYR